LIASSVPRGLIIAIFRYLAIVTDIKPFHHIVTGVAGHRNSRINALWLAEYDHLAMKVKACSHWQDGAIINI
jgi:hypothetical protein